jgi:hypothetical protein
MVSTMTFERAMSALARYRGIEPEEARRQIVGFLGDDIEEDQFAQDVRIVLASAEFSKELTTAVLWLNERELDIRCVRLRPYRDGTRILLDVTQVLPLPEAQDYQVRLREKETRERQASQPWSREEFMASLRQEGGDAETADRFLDWARGQGFILRWTHGKRRGGVQAVLAFGAESERYIPFRLRSDGVLVIRIDWVHRKPALVDGKLLAEFRTALAAVPGIDLPADSNERPRFPIALLANPASWGAFTNTIVALADGIRAWYAERGIEADGVGSEEDD